jgi:hypothetical protein
MNRTATQTFARGLLLALPATALLVGCAGRKPVAEIARADQALRHAQTTSEAQTYAPAELAAAQAKLVSARRAVDVGDYDDARRLAEQALADAQLAEAKAESRVALEQASRTRADIEVLQAEVASPSTVVVERRTVQSAPAAVVVESPAPRSVVIEKPAQPATVVIERDPAVVVVPE